MRHYNFFFFLNQFLTSYKLYSVIQFHQLVLIILNFIQEINWKLD